MSDFLPNSFQMPVAYVDRLWHLLSSDEKSVLTYMARRIFGFGKRSDRISLSQFVNGTKSKKTGENLDYGCGLGKSAVVKILADMCEFGLVEILEAARPAEHLPPLYTLQLDSHKVDFAGLKERREAKKEAGRARSQKARMAAQTANISTTNQSVGLTGPPVSGTDYPPSVAQTHNKQWEKQDLAFNKELGVSNSRCKSEFSEDLDFDFPSSFE